MVKIGIIGGSGLDDPKLLENYEEKEINTKYGFPSSKIVCGSISRVDVCILARHGKNHNIPPSAVNYQANIAALKMLGCDYIIATSAVGSLKEEIAPGYLVFPDQFIDFTKKRKNSFYESSEEVVHCEMAEPFSEKLREKLSDIADNLGFRNHKKATIVVIEGPRFSTKAESNMFRQFADIIGMTAVPECSLAKEAGIPYATIAMATDYDCWRENTEPVTFEMILKTMENNAEKVKKILINVIRSFDDKNIDFIKNKIRTVPNFPKPGIMFKDITTLLRSKEGFERTIELFYERFKDQKIDVVAGIESRGFIFGSALAYRLGVAFVPIRKRGKLPYEKVSQDYSLEYGTDTIEIHKDAVNPGGRVLIIDDLIATGGTARASGDLIEKIGGDIVGFGFVIGLTDLGGKEKLEKWDVYTIVEFEGE